MPQVCTNISPEHAPLNATSPLIPPPMMAEDGREDTAGRAHERWRRWVGLGLLLMTVLLWTASNFLASVSVAHEDMYTCLRSLCANTMPSSESLRRRHVFQAVPSHLCQHFLLRPASRSSSSQGRLRRPVSALCPQTILPP